MILDKLTLRNFCLFHGKQLLDLSPGRRNGKGRRCCALLRAGAEPRGGGVCHGSSGDGGKRAD